MSNLPRTLADRSGPCPVRRSSGKRRAMTMCWLIAVLVLSALVPRGYMVAPSAAHGFEITVCPQTNPLGRAALARDGGGGAGGHAHALMGHTLMGHTLMGHTLAASADGGEGHAGDDAPSSARGGGDCAFAGVGAAGVAPDPAAFEPALQAAANIISVTHHRLALRRLDRLRPPLRAPPAAG